MKPMRINPKKNAPNEYGDKTFFRDDKGYIPKAVAILESVGNLRLVGETGTGKSTIVAAMCDEFDWELHEYQLSTETSRFDLLAQDILVPDTKGGTAILPRLGTIAESILTPKDKSKTQVLFLDEFNYAQPAVMTIMNSLTDARRSVRIPELAGAKARDGVGTWDFTKGDPIVKRPPNHYVIIGMNPSEKAAYSGTIAMNIAQLRRFESLYIDYLSMESEEEVIKRTIAPATLDPFLYVKWLNFASWTRAQYKAEKLSAPVTTGNLINYARLATNTASLNKGPLSVDEITEIMCGMYHGDEMKKVRATLETIATHKLFKPNED